MDATVITSSRRPKKVFKTKVVGSRWYSSVVMVSRLVYKMRLMVDNEMMREITNIFQKTDYEEDQEKINEPVSLL